jgi:putative ABC transport system permease protein
MITIHFYLRILAKFFFTNAIKVVGTTLSLSACFIILIVFINESGFDSYHTNKRNIFRILSVYDETDEVYANTPLQLGPILCSHIPEINDYFRYRKIYEVFIETGNTGNTENDLVCVDSSFLSALTIDGEDKNLSRFLSPQTILISKSISTKYFGNKNPLDKTLKVKIDNIDFLFKVIGVFDDQPSNSVFQFNFITHFDLLYALDPNLKALANQDLMRQSYFSTFIIKDEGDVGSLEKKIGNFIDQYTGGSHIYSFRLQNIEDMYLKSTDVYNNHYYPSNDYFLVQIMGWMALLLIGVAVLNHILLSNSQLVHRLKEIGIRRVYGASPKNIAALLVIENLFILVISLLLAFTIILFAHPLLENYLGIDFSLNFNLVHKYFLWIFAVILLFITLSSAFSAFYVFSIRINKVLSIKAMQLKQKLGFVQVLFIFQLLVLICLISLSSIGQRQLNFLHNKNLGFNAQNLIALQLWGDAPENYEILCTKIEQSPNVESISAARNVPFLGPFMTWGLLPDPNDSRIVDIKGFLVDYNFFQTIGINIIDGRGFNENSISDLSQAIILNQSAVKYLEYEVPINEEVNGRKLIGITEDFHIFSMHHPIPPIAFHLLDKNPFFIIIRCRVGTAKQVMNHCNDIWQQILPETYFDCRMMNEVVNKEYVKDGHIVKFAIAGTLMILFVLLIGLYGLSYTISNNKTREMCMRKIFGASPLNIFLRLLKVFLVPLLISYVLSIPLIFHFANILLDRYEYRVPIDIFPFIISLLLAGLIILISSIHPLIKLSLINPLRIIQIDQ